MQVQLVEDGPCRRTLTITIPPERVRTHLDEVYKSASKQVQMKGFRSGHVPRKVLEKKFGDSILREAKESLVTQSFQDAVRQHELAIVGRPRIEGLDEKPLAADQQVEFEVHLDIRPKIELGEVTGISIDSQPTEVTDEDVTTGLDQLADQKKTLDTIDEPVGEGDFIRSDMQFLDEGGNSVFERKDARLNAAIPVAGTDPEVFAAQLDGKAKGDEFTVEITFPETFEKEEVRGQTGKLNVSVLDVLRVQPPPIDDALAKDFGFDSLELMTTELRERIGEEKVRGEKLRQEEKVLESIVNDHPFELPQSMVDDQAEHQLQVFRQRLEEEKVPEDEIEQKLLQSKDEAQQDAARRIRMFFILDAVAQKHEIQVSGADVDVEIRNIAAQHQTTPETVREFYEKNQNLNELQVGIMERKVRDFLRENASIADKKDD